MKRILAKNPSLQAVTLPAKSYPGQDAAIQSVGSWSYVFAWPGLPEEQGYLLARADLILPGVQKYLREAGLLRN